MKVFVQNKKTNLFELRHSSCFNLLCIEADDTREHDPSRPYNAVQ